jgi:hypothetical protein
MVEVAGSSPNLLHFLYFSKIFGALMAGMFNGQGVTTQSNSPRFIRRGGGYPAAASRYLALSLGAASC